MQGERIEIRTPNEKLLVCTLIQQDGAFYAEVRSRKKSDHISLDVMINMLSAYNKK